MCYRVEEVAEEHGPVPPSHLGRVDGLHSSDHVDDHPLEEVVGQVENPNGDICRVVAFNELPRIVETASSHSLDSKLGLQILSVDVNG